MNLIFNYENPIHHFRATGEMTDQDVKVIRAALYRLFESHPEYVVLNLSAIKSSQRNPSVLLTQVLTELTSLALSQKIFFHIVKTEEDEQQSLHLILEAALEQKQAILRSKNQVNEQIKITAELLREENTQLKQQLNHLREQNTENPSTLGTLLDRFWSNQNK